MGSIEELKIQWKHVYATHLPQLAKARDPVQKQWPVYLDHCFARIVLDNAIGKDKPWTEVLKGPAISHMDAAQFKSAICLAEKIATGQADLVALNDFSLQLRGKHPKRKAQGEGEMPIKKAAKKAKADGLVSHYFKKTDDAAVPDQRGDEGKTKVAPVGENWQEKSVDADMAAELDRIKNSNLTAFRKQALAMLCQIPRGRYSTYGAMSDFISKTSHKTCARAVGSAMRNNPFAPGVPCHRVLAGDGSLGGFNGSWGEKGTYASEKHRLLDEEGVRFDSSGKVKGPPFRDFTAVSNGR